MGAQVSQAMKKARKLLAANPHETDAEIARRAGLHTSSLGKDRVCRAIRAAHAKPSKSAQALALIEQGMPRKQAEQQIGLHPRSIDTYLARLKKKQQQEKDDGENS